MNTGYTAKYSSETSDGSTTIIGTDNITIPDPNLISFKRNTKYNYDRGNKAIQSAHVGMQYFPIFL